MTPASKRLGAAEAGVIVWLARDAPKLFKRCEHDRQAVWRFAQVHGPTLAQQRLNKGYCFRRRLSSQASSINMFLTFTGQRLTGNSSSSSSGEDPSGRPLSCCDGCSSKSLRERSWSGIQSRWRVESLPTLKCYPALGPLSPSDKPCHDKVTIKFDTWAKGQSGALHLPLLKRRQILSPSHVFVLSCSFLTSGNFTLPLHVDDMSSEECISGCAKRKFMSSSAFRAGR